ncbi:hypothetical protein [Nocardia iowensis]|uniref:Uncharacterized protein n=1 Tax=Nocardia iowensis TaxID=204891 RepID=A0ABX8RW86_NOCIO|nr:hypothetical protein [Nocardia iowensis]QXN93929.1 hypothetical protein KV110_13225 [Nocardia iowensis]
MHAYIGSVPYCYSNSLAMILGDQAPPVGVIETLTGAPFGAQVEDDTLPFFDPVGWHPEIGLDAAIDLIGWSCTRTEGGSATEALDRLRTACAQGPVLAGPVELGLMLYRPSAGKAVGADHYVVVLGVEDDTVLLHDPQGYPFATLPTAAFADSWRAEEVSYIDTPFVMRSAFVRDRVVAPVDALESSMPQAIRWLSGASAAIGELAEMAGRGLDPAARNLLAIFGIRLGSRRLIDAAANLTMLGRTEAAAVAAEQSRMIGGLQYPLVTGDDAALIAGLNRLAPGYDRLRAALEA